MATDDAGDAPRPGSARALRRTAGPALCRPKTPDGSGAVLVDATLGAGGHSERLLEEFPGLRVIGLDRDPDALAIAGRRLARFGDRVDFVRTRYDGIATALTEKWFGGNTIH